MYLNFNPRNLVGSILATTNADMANNVYSLQEPNTSIQVAERHIILKNKHTSVFLYNSL